MFFVYRHVHNFVSLVSGCSPYSLACGEDQRIRTEVTKKDEERVNTGLPECVVPLLSAFFSWHAG